MLENRALRVTAKIVPLGFCKMPKYESQSRPRSRFSEDVVSTSLRIPVSLKRRVDAAAALRGLTVNALILDTLDEAFPQGHGFEGELANVMTSLANFEPGVVTIENAHALEQANAALQELQQRVSAALAKHSHLED